jgi:hypothetical protein
MGRVLDDEDEAELPEIRRQTPVSDGIQTSPKAPARLADGLEVEGPPPGPPGYAPGELRLAHWFPRSAPERRGFGFIEHTPSLRTGQRAIINPADADTTPVRKPEDL